MNPAGELVKIITQSSPDVNAELPAQWLEVLGQFRTILEGITIMFFIYLHILCVNIKVPTKPFLQLDFDTRKQLVDTIVQRLRSSKSNEGIDIIDLLLSSF